MYNSTSGWLAGLASLFSTEKEKEEKEKKKREQCKTNPWAEGCMRNANGTPYYDPAQDWNDDKVLSGLDQAGWNSDKTMKVLEGMSSLFGGAGGAGGGGPKRAMPDLPAAPLMPVNSPLASIPPQFILPLLELAGILGPTGPKK